MALKLNFRIEQWLSMLTVWKLIPSESLINVTKKPNILIKNDNAKILAVKIVNNQILESKCSFTDVEKHDALSFFLEKKGVTLKSFNKINAMGSTLIKGLELLLSTNKSKEQVFSELNMNDNGITLIVWNTYTKKYNTEDSIVRLKKMLPNNMDSIVNTDRKGFGDLLERLYLDQKIIGYFDRANPTMINTSNIVKQKSWWETKLKDYSMDKQKEDEVLYYILSTSSFNKLSSRNLKIMHDYLIDKGEE